MKWENLKNMKCPDCGKKIRENDYGDGYICDREEGGCGFRISEKRFKEIVEKLYKPHVYERRYDNQEFLNRL